MCVKPFRDINFRLPGILTLVLIIIFSSLPVASAATLGDVDDDGVVDVQDISKMMRHVLGLKILDEVHLKTADVNCDGEVNVLDVTLIMQKVLGLIDDFPASNIIGLDFYRHDVDELPGEVKEWLENSRENFKGQTYQYNNMLYILVTYGRCPTTGYAVQIKEINKCNTRVIVNAHFTIDSPASTIITYPYDLVILQDPDLPVIFKATGAEKEVPVK